MKTLLILISLTAIAGAAKAEQASHFGVPSAREAGKSAVQKQGSSLPTGKKKYPSHGNRGPVVDPTEAIVTKGKDGIPLVIVKGNRLTIKVGSQGKFRVKFPGKEATSFEPALEATESGKGGKGAKLTYLKNGAWNAIKTGEGNGAGLGYTGETSVTVAASNPEGTANAGDNRRLFVYFGTPNKFAGK